MGRRKYFVLTRGGVCVGHGVVCGRVPRPPVRWLFMDKMTTNYVVYFWKFFLPPTVQN